MGINTPDQDPNKSVLDADLDDPWWTTPCEDCGEIPLSLVPYGVTECKCLRDKRKKDYFG